MHFLILVFISVTLWASLATLVTQLSHLPPFLLLAASLFIGGALSVPKWRNWQFKPVILFIGVTGIFGYHFLLFMALRISPSVSANLLNYLWPLFILLLTPVFFPKTRITSKQLTGTLIAFIGAALIVLQTDVELSFKYGVGYLFAILAAITWSVYTLMTKRVANFSSATVGLFCLFSSLFSLIFHLLFEQTPTLERIDLYKIILIGIGPMGISFYCWDAAVKKGDPRVIASIAYLIPLLSTGLLVFFNGQTITQSTFYAIPLIIGGAIIANLPNSNTSTFIK